MLCVGLLAAGCGRSDIYQRLTWPEAFDGGELPVLCRPADVQTFELPAKPRQPIDVLLVIDDSCSMENDQKELANNFASFIPAFLAANVSFHVGVVTTDMAKPTRLGKLVAPPLTPQTPLLETTFQKMVQVGAQGSAIEKGIAAAYAALSEPLISNENKGFLRPEANLAVVFLTDEDDQSGYGYSPAIFTQFLTGLKADRDAITVASILGLKQPPYCSTSVSNWKYADVARAFLPRAHLTVCNPAYDATLKAIAGRIINSHCLIELRREIDVHRPIRVTVNGQPSEWSLIPGDAMRPFGSLEVKTCPVTAAHVEITYEDCEPSPE